MKFLAAMCVFASMMCAEVYYAKVEPYEIRDISSNVSGLILEANEDLLGKKLSSKPFIKIDSELDTKELSTILSKLDYLKDVISKNEKILENLQESLERKRANYDKIKSLSIKSSVEKDREFYDLVNSENLFYNTQKEVLNLKIQLSDLEFRKSQLQRSISDKNVVADGFVLYSLKVKPGQVVSFSAPLAQVADTSKAKLTIFLNDEDVLEADKKVVYIDGKKTDYKLSRVVKVADATNISKYMAQVVVKSPEVFSNLVKIELK